MWEQGAIGIIGANGKKGLHYILGEGVRREK